jgi:hypothetical protein
VDSCAKHGITSDTEVIALADINTAYQRMMKGDVKHRFVIDMATLKQRITAGADAPALSYPQGRLDGGSARSNR